MTGTARVLVVEDDDAVRELVAFHLRRGGFRVLEAASAAEAWPQLESADVVVLDRMLPDESGDAFMARLRAGEELERMPVLMLTARATEVDRVEGFEAGADDYVTKPFSALELVARLRALTRRVPRGQTFTSGDLRVDLDRMRVERAGSEIALSRREFALLAFLIAHPGRVFGRWELLDQVWGGEFVGGHRTVDQHVSQLRNRLGSSAIETVRGRGYRIGSPDRRG